MPSMENLISEYYAQTTSANADIEKQAQVELFAKLAADNGIDLEQLSEDQIGYLWNETFKTAAEDKKDEHEEHETAHEERVEEKKEEAEKKAEAAYYEYAEKRAAAAKVAEADFLGRYMAHAMTDEIKKIAGAREAVGRAGKAVGDRLERLGKGVVRTVGRTGGAEAAMHPGTAKAIGAATLGTGATVLGGGAYAAKKHHDKKQEKSASAIDELAAELAVEKAASVGWDQDEAVGRIVSVLTLGVGESEKIAFAQSLEDAVETRSLELLEAAGYPVTWNG